jgi:hypothetical protein
MKTSISLAKATAIVSILLMTSVMLIANVPNVSVVQADEVSISGPLPAGKTPAVITETVLSLSAKPAVVGVGQSVLVNVWLNPSVTRTRVIKTYTFTITPPDGNEIVWNQDAEPATTATWFEYALDQVGEWKIKVEFNGCYFNGTNNEATESAYYLPASPKETTVTCQQELNPSWPAEALPTDYWTRPVDFVHRDWWPILGNFPADGYDGTHDPEWDTRYPGTNPHWSSQYDFVPWVQSPQSSHIVWLELNQPAGIVGGEVGFGANSIGSDLRTSIYRSVLVCAGRGYRTVTKPMLTLVDGEQQLVQTNLWQCYDIRTGEVFWEQTCDHIPTFIEYETAVTTAAHSGGSVAQYLIYLSSSQLIKYDPVTGNMLRNLTVDMSGTYYKNEYVLSVQNLGSSVPIEDRYRLINWTIAGNSNDFASRIISNTSYARSSLPSVIDWNTGLGATVSGITIAGVYAGVNVTGYSLYTGETLWSHRLDNVSLFSGSCTIADHGKVAFNLQHVGDQLGYYMAYDLATGNIAWRGEVMDYPWSSTGFGAYGVASAYGMIIHPGYSGITAYNWTDGKIVWTYHKYSPAPFESPYTDANGTEVFSFNSGVRIADGVVYAYNCEHTTTWPRTRGWSTVAVNITTGEEIWSIGMPGNAAFGNSPDIGAIADGYMSMETDLGYFVMYGKGKSATTVTAPDVVMPLGNGIVIRGTVLDQSPAQPDTPCVSKESMTLQMEYLHLQTSIKGLWGNETVIGVPVMLTAIGSDGTVYDLGTTTTNGYSGVFSFTWTPPEEGTYEIYATFVGDESYGSSMATTAIAVGPAPEQIQFPEEATPIDYTMTIVGVGIAILIAVIITFAAAVLILKNR